MRIFPRPYQAYWQKLASLGRWWTGAERVAIAAESRNVLTCDFCQARKQAWVNDNVTRGITKEAYVELMGVVVTVFSIDEFHRALGLTVEALPTPAPGEISRYRPAIVREDIGFVPTIPADGNVGNEADIWDGVRAANVMPSATYSI